jgi:RNA 2',3'-cyclic 3'-phosphodiesterase
VTRPLRLFIAALPPAGWADAVASSHALHLTLQFLGETRPRDLDQIAESMQRAASGIGPVTLQATHLSTLPADTDTPPRLLAILTTNPPQLQELHRRLAHRLARPRRSTGRVDTETFLPHLSIERYKPRDNPTPRHDPLTLPDWTITEIHLIQSTLTPTGPIHTTLWTAQL